MDLNKLYQQLSYGPLSNLAMANDGNGTITDKKKPAIVAFANEALLRLYTRFPMLQKSVIVEMYEHITNYHLTYRFARSNQDRLEPFPYIQDHPMEPFKDDVIKILSVYDSFGNDLLVNDPNHPFSVFVPEDKIVQVSHPICGQALSIQYQAKHPTLSDSDPEQSIILPEVLWPALYAYIAYMVFDGINVDGSAQRAANQFNKYTAICDEAVVTDVLNISDSYTSDRFYDRGWK